MTLPSSYTKFNCLIRYVPDPEPRDPRKRALGSTGTPLPDRGVWLPISHGADGKGMTITAEHPTAWYGCAFELAAEELGGDPQYPDEPFVLGGGDIVEPSLRSRLSEWLTDEIASIDQFLRGDVWGFEVVHQISKGHDECYGWFGADKDYMIRDAEASAEYLDFLWRSQKPV